MIGHGDAELTRYSILVSLGLDGNVTLTMLYEKIGTQLTPYNLKL